MEDSLLSAEIESQVLLITVPNDFKETELPQSSLSDFSQITNPNTENGNSLQGCYTSLEDEMENHEASGSALSVARNDCKKASKKLVNLILPNPEEQRQWFE